LLPGRAAEYVLGLNSIPFKNEEAENRWIVNLVSFEEFLRIGIAVLANEARFHDGKGGRFGSR